jgi:hypothetical protein
LGISVLGGFLSGFLGLGGAIVISPLLLLLPPVFGFQEITMKTVAGLSMLQVFFGSLSGSFVHRKNNFINNNIFIYVGIPLSVAALAGSYFSKFLSNLTVMLIFDFFVILCFILLFKNEKNSKDETDSKNLKFDKRLSILLGTVTGIVSGIIGAGGGILMIPAFIKIYKLSVKTAIGTSLAIVFLGSVFGALGKILSFQVDYLLAIPIIIGSLLSARLGAKVNKITPQAKIRLLLLTVIFISFLQVSYKIFLYLK